MSTYAQSIILRNLYFVRIYLKLCIDLDHTAYSTKMERGGSTIKMDRDPIQGNADSDSVVVFFK